MVRLALCIEMYWTDQPYDERIRRAAAAGLKAVEFWNYSDKDVPGLAATAKAAGVAVTDFVCEPGFALTGTTPLETHVAGVHKAAAVARQLGVSTLIVTAGNVVAGASDAMTYRHVVRKLTAMAQAAQAENVTLVLEPLNPFDDHPGYWLTTMAQAAGIVEDVGNDHLKILYDIYHQQLTEGKIIANLRQYAPLIGHIHVAGAPGRGKLVGGDLDYRAVFAAIDAVGYTGHVGLEFRAAGQEEAALTEALALTK